MARLLLTGGAGFIGSHTALVLLQAGHHLVVLDDFRNSNPEALKRVEQLSGKQITLVAGNLNDPACLERLFKGGPYGIGGSFDAVIHFAGLKAVAESLYGIPSQVPIPESAQIQPINPYGHSKAAAEQLLADLAGSSSCWRIARLRYFNPVGAHPSGLIGEDPAGIPNNLFPFVSQVAVGKRPELLIFGDDWPTIDGTGVRDYIHVMDLAEGHAAALEVLLAGAPQLLTLNLGSGEGHSVLQVLNGFEQACGRELPYRIVDRRPGDAAITVADPSLAKALLGWHTKRNLAQICTDGWAWQAANPNGYR